MKKKERIISVRIWQYCKFAIQQLEVVGMRTDQIEILLVDEWIECVNLTEHFEKEDELHYEGWFTRQRVSIFPIFDFNKGRKPQNGTKQSTQTVYSRQAESGRVKTPFLW